MFVGLESRSYLDGGVPDFQSTVPSYGGEVRGLVGFGGFVGRRVSYAGYPVLVVQGVGFVFLFS